MDRRPAPRCWWQMLIPISDSCSVPPRHSSQESLTRSSMTTSPISPARLSRNKSAMRGSSRRSSSCRAGDSGEGIMRPLRSSDQKGNTCLGSQPAVGPAEPAQVDHCDQVAPVNRSIKTSASLGTSSSIRVTAAAWSHGTGEADRQSPSVDVLAVEPFD